MVNRTLADTAYFRIREAILRGRIPLGATLSRRRLTAELKSSLAPVAEALQRLESDGLVESRPRAGTRVRVPTEQDIRDSYILREALETMSARLFAIEATERERREMLRMAEHTDFLFSRCDAGASDAEFLYEVHAYHMELHMRIARIGGCSALAEAFEKNQILIQNWVFDVAAHHQLRPPRWHTGLVETLVTATPVEAEDAMRRHVRYGLDDIVASIAASAPKHWRARRREVAPATTAAANEIAVNKRNNASQPSLLADPATR